MAWTAPKTWVAENVLTAAELNTHLRDNLLETAPAKATTEGSLFIASGANAIVERTPDLAAVTAAESTSSTSFTDLTTSGPAVTVVTGTSALVFVYARHSNSTADAGALMSWALSGATTRTAQDSTATESRSAANNNQRLCSVDFMTGFTAGTNTVTCKYRVTAGTGTFADRRLIVIPL